MSHIALFFHIVLAPGFKGEDHLLLLLTWLSLTENYNNLLYLLHSQRKSYQKKKKHVRWDSGVLSPITHKTVTDAVFPGNGKCAVIEAEKQNTE